MAIINKTGITNGGTIQAEHVTRAIDALSGGSTDTVVATGSFSGSFKGDGSQLSGLSAGFPYTGSARITGSLAVTGSLVVKEGATEEIINSVTRTLAKSGGNVTVDWENYRLGSNTTSVDWQNRFLYDNDEVESVNWGSRELYNSLGQTVVNWDAALFSGSITFATTASYATGSDMQILYNSGSKFAANSALNFNYISQSLAHGNPNVVASGQYSHAEGSQTAASGTFSHAEGRQTDAYGSGSHSEGIQTLASGNYSHAEGGRTIASGYASHAEGYFTTASGSYSHAEGRNTQASGDYAHAEGYLTTASGNYSHAEGLQTVASGTGSHAKGIYSIASGNAAHAEGFQTTASGNYSHAEGIYTTTIGEYSHAEGSFTRAIGDYSHAEGYYTTASDAYSHAEGSFTNAFEQYSHAEGQGTIATKFFSHAEGAYTRAAGYASHAEGYLTTASGDYSNTRGLSTEANRDYMSATGRFNVTGSTDAYAYFVVGKGTSTAARSNAFRVSGSGECLAGSTFTNGGADYAEYFESYDAQPIPVGTTVELTGSFIKICENAENAIGVISNKPSILGNSDEGTADEWVGKYEKDIWGNYIMESYEYERATGNDAAGNVLYETIKDTRRKLNSNYNPTIEYIPRAQRPEWNVVGLLGQIRVLKNQQIPARWIKMQDIDSEVALYLVR